MHRRVCIVVACLGMIAFQFAMLGHAAADGQPHQPDLVAEHAIVVDAATGAVLFDKSSDDRVPPASLTKLITAAVAVEMEPLDTRMTVQPSDLVGEASMGLRVGETLTLDTLLHGMLMVSGNDAASVVARESGQLTFDSPWQGQQRFLDAANARVESLGMANTHLVNPHGLDEADQYSSARDLAAMTLFLARNAPGVLAMAGAQTWNGEGHTLTNTNELLGRYPGLVAGKTGYTRGAGYCLMEIAQRDGRAIITVLLASTEDAWYSDAIALLDYGFAVAPLVAANPAVDRISLQPQVLATNSAFQGAASVTEASSSSLPFGSGLFSQWRRMVVGLVGLACLSVGVAAALAARSKPQAVAMPRRSATPPRSAEIAETPRHWQTEPLPVVGFAASGFLQTPIERVRFEATQPFVLPEFSASTSSTNRGRAPQISVIGKSRHVSRTSANHRRDHRP